MHTDSHISFDKRLYSVPYRYLKREAWVRATPDTVTIYIDDERVATHDRGGRTHRTTDDAHLPVERVSLRHRGDVLTRRAEELGEEVKGLVREIFAQEQVLNPLRTVQQIVTLLEKHPRDRANNAARRARHFGTRSYGGLREILRKALDFEPLPASLPSTTHPTPKPTPQTNPASPAMSPRC